MKKTFDGGLKKENPVRTVTKFLYLPKTINNKTKWLTRASWAEEFKEDPSNSEPFYYGACYKWVPYSWLDL